MKSFFGHEERRLSNLKPKVETPPELRRKLQKEQNHSAKQQRNKK